MGSFVFTFAEERGIGDENFCLCGFFMGLENLPSLKERYRDLTSQMETCGLGAKVTKFEFAVLNRKRKEVRRLIETLEGSLFPDGAA